MAICVPRSREELCERLRQALEPHEEVLEAYLFGSQARGEAAAHSDVDVAVFIDEAKAPASAFGYGAELTTDLMQALRTHQIDVVVLNRAPPLLYHRVLRGGVRFARSGVIFLNHHPAYGLHAQSIDAVDVG